MPVPQSKLATFPQGAGSPDLPFEAISSWGKLKRVGSSILPRLSGWSNENDGDVQGVVVGRGLSALWALSHRHLTVRGSATPLRLSSCSDCFLSGSFSRGGGVLSGVWAGGREGFETQQTLLYYVYIFQGLFFN